MGQHNGSDLAVASTDGVTPGTTTLVNVTLSTDTSAYANGDLLADTQIVSGALRLNGTGVIESLIVLDEDDNTAYAFDVYFLSGSGSMGTENSAVTVADAVAQTILGFHSFAAADVKDLVNSKIYCKNSLRIPIKAATDTKDFYIAAAIVTGTPTHTATGIKVRLGIRQD
jgi:hypothetical protein